MRMARVMVNMKSKKTILCTWEMGSDLGHIASLSRIAEALESDGYRVVLALKDLSRCYPFFRALKAQIIQAPICLLQLQMQRPIACQADALLLSGYLDADMLLMLTKAWQSIVQLVQPDLIVFNYSPTALLALREQTRIKKMIVGKGFSEPEAGHPITDWRSPHVNDNLIATQERVVLRTINRVLERLNKSPLECLSELWRVDKMILDEFPPFDPYHKLRTDAIYCHKQYTKGIHSNVEFPETGRKKIIAYLKPAYPKLDQLLEALAVSSADVFVVCPLGPEHVLKSYESDHFKYTTSLVNLAEGLTRADLFVGHGNATSVKEALNAEIPTLVFPQQQEQLLIGAKLQELGAGVLILHFESAIELSGRINNHLSDTVLRDRVKNIKKKYNGCNQTVASTVKCSVEKLLFH
jgi:hypothetical protein